MPLDNFVSPSPPNESSAGLQAFLDTFCRNLGMECEWPEEGLATIHLTHEAASLLEGHRTPGYTCKLALSTQVAAKHKDAALFVPGSYHWDRVLEIVLEKARLCRHYVVGIPGFIDAERMDSEPDGGQLIYEPHLLMQWRLSYRSDDTTRHRIFDLTVNLTSGDIYHGYYHSLLPCQLDRSPLPHITQAKARIRYQQAYRFMTEEIQYLLADEDPSWATSANMRLSTELLALEQYYADRALDETLNELLNAEKSKRIHELKERLAPKVVANPFATALLYIPVVTYEIDIDGQALGLRFDPVTGQAIG